jgi:hypothetical protein
MSGRETGPESGSRPSIVNATKRVAARCQNRHLLAWEARHALETGWGLPTRELVERVIIGSERVFGNILFGNDLIVAAVATLPFTTPRNHVRSFFVCLEIDCPARWVERSGTRVGRSRFDFASHWDRRCKRPAKVVGESDDTAFSDSPDGAPPRLTSAPMRATPRVTT